MYIKLHKIRDYVNGNASSCAQLVKYLEKENLEKTWQDKEYFFNQELSSATPEQVIHTIDRNVKGLKKEDAKFYMLTINPSQK